MIESRKINIYSALAANVLVAGTKFAAGAITHSASMVSEGIHTMVDTSNELLLLYGLHQSQKPRDDSHPWGYGKELYFWSFVVSILIFGFGGGISIYQGVVRIIHPLPVENPRWNYIVLGISFAFEGVSLYISARQFNKERGKLSWWAALVKSKDPSNFVIVIENFADVIGIGIVFISILLMQVFHLAWLDGVASVLVGLLLVAMSAIVARESRSLLMGEGITQENHNKIIKMVETDKAVGKVLQLYSIYQSPEEIALIITLAFAEHLDTDGINTAITRIKQRIMTEFKLIKFVVIQPKGEE